MTSSSWYQRTLRWGQTNLVEIDPQRYDSSFWRDQWRRTRVQGVIINAGGILAYYPSAFPLHRRAEALGNRDLYGEIVVQAREDGLSVIARMDSNRVAQPVFDAHPDWICRDINGEPYRLADKYVTCIGSPYYRDYLPLVMQEIIDRSRPDGFADNSWAGLPQDCICYCKHCQTQFQERCGQALPRSHDWQDAVYRDWITWNYERRTELWDHNNRATKAAGGDHCLWFGMVDGNIGYNCHRFIDLRAILGRAPMVLLDHQRRSRADGFAQNTEVGKRLHALLGWDKLIPESTPQYQLGEPIFRLASMPPPETKLWATSGFAGGIQPWWHHIGADHEDRRQYETAEPLFRWHEANQDILVDREPEAQVAIVWSQNNHDFFGRDAAELRVMSPYRGLLKALDRSGILYVPLHADDLEKAINRFKVVFLPNIGFLTSAQIEALKHFAETGGTVVATGFTSSADMAGTPLAQPALADLFGLRFTGKHVGGMDAPIADWDWHERHSYLRLTPELRASQRGPRGAAAQAPIGDRHPFLAGLDQTDTVPFGGYLPEVEIAASDTQNLATLIPEFPIYPPETAWMRQSHSDRPALTVRPLGKGRLVWLLADLDRCFDRDEHGEHARILANIATYGMGDAHHIRVSGTHGVVTLDAYRQNHRSIIHLNNRLALSPVPGRQYDIIPIGPVELSMSVPAPRQAPAMAELRVAGGQASIILTADGRVTIMIPAVHDHEVVVVDWL